MLAIPACLLLVLPADPLPPRVQPGAQEPSPPVTPAASAPRWSFTLEPFIWFASIDGHGSAGSTPPTDIGADFSLFGELAGGFLLAGEARPREGRLGWIGDGLVLSLADSDGRLQTETNAAMLELGGAYALGAERTWEVIAGLRYVDLEFRVDLAGHADASARSDWIDPWVGARGTLGLGGDWELLLRADVGGFGVGTQLSWQALAGVRWSFSDRLRLDLGYRAISLDFDDDDLAYDALVQGAVLGLAIRL